MRKTAAPHATAVGSSAAQADHPLTIAALKVLRPAARLAYLVGDDLEEITEETWGAFVSPEENRNGRVKVYWTRWGSLRDRNDKVFKDELAELAELFEADPEWIVEPGSHLCLTVWHVPTLSAAAEAAAEAEEKTAPPADFWSVRTKDEVEITRVYGVTYEEARANAEKHRSVVRYIRAKGGVSYRRLNEGELTALDLLAIEARTGK